MKSAGLERVKAEPCRCVLCPCNGTISYGAVFRMCEGFGEPCDYCYGGGVVRVCDRCRLLEEMEQDRL